MDNLKEIIYTFSEEQQKEFVSFIQRGKYRKDRKDLMLFELLCSDRVLSPQQLKLVLKCPNINAYHSVRKRLFQHLADFVVLQATTSDASVGSHINTLIAVIRYLFDKNLPEHAWKYLQIAEQLAEKNDYFDYLNSIYLLQLEKNYLHPTYDFNIILEKFNVNKIAQIQAEKIQLTCALLRKNCIEANLAGIIIDFEKELKNALLVIELEKTVLERPRIVLEFVKTIRAIAFNGKNYVLFQHYLTDTIKKLKESNKILSPEIETELYYYFAHILYRNRNFSLAEKQLLIVSQTLPKCSLSFQNNFMVKIRHLNAALVLYAGKIDDSIKELTNLLTNTKMSKRDENNTLINLGIYLFLAGKNQQALKLLNSFKHSDTWLQKTLGLEWVMKKQLMEILLFVDLNHLDLYQSRIKAFKRKYSSLKSHSIYHRIFGFIQALENIHAIKQTKKPQKELEKYLSFFGDEQEDLQAMTFYAWLKAKINQKEFYPTLIQIAVGN